LRSTIPEMPGTLRAARSLLVCAALALGAAACDRAPDSPGGPGRAAPKTAATAPEAAAPDPVGVVRIPASPSDVSPESSRQPTRIWM